jgi:hypothetical protein
MQAALDDYLEAYTTTRPHQRRGMNRRKPNRAAVESMPKNHQKENDPPDTDDQAQNRLRPASNSVTFRETSFLYKQTLMFSRFLVSSFPSFVSPISSPAYYLQTGKASGQGASFLQARPGSQA